MELPYFGAMCLTPGNCQCSGHYDCVVIRVNVKYVADQTDTIRLIRSIRPRRTLGCTNGRFSHRHSPVDPFLNGIEEAVNNALQKLFCLETWLYHNSLLFFILCKTGCSGLACQVIDITENAPFRLLQ